MRSIELAPDTASSLNGDDVAPLQNRHGVVEIMTNCSQNKL